MRHLKHVIVWAIISATSTAVCLLPRHHSVGCQTLAIRRICANTSSFATLLTHVNVPATTCKNLLPLAICFVDALYHPCLHRSSKFVATSIFVVYSNLALFCPILLFSIQKCAFFPLCFLFTTSFATVSCYLLTPR